MAVPVAPVLLCLGLGALSYQTRKHIEAGETPSPGAALSFAKGHFAAFLLSPVLVCARLGEVGLGETIARQVAREVASEKGALARVKVELVRARDELSREREALVVEKARFQERVDTEVASRLADSLGPSREKLEAERAELERERRAVADETRSLSEARAELDSQVRTFEDTLRSSVAEGVEATLAPERTKLEAARAEVAETQAAAQRKLAAAFEHEKTWSRKTAELEKATLSFNETVKAFLAEKAKAAPAREEHRTPSRLVRRRRY